MGFLPRDGDLGRPAAGHVSARPCITPGDCRTHCTNCGPIPDSVELGFHLCYGDFGARHFVEPVDSSKMVEVVNSFSAAVKRPIAYFHIPVPITRNDDDFYRPLKNLKLPAGTEFYLGLVHAKDGPEGTQRRIDVARKYVSDFGIATECGFARARTRQVIEQILDVHLATTTCPRPPEFCTALGSRCRRLPCTASGSPPSRLLLSVLLPAPKVIGQIGPSRSLCRKPRAQAPTSSAATLPNNYQLVWALLETAGAKRRCAGGCTFTRRRLHILLRDGGGPRHQPPYIQVALLRSPWRLHAGIDGRQGTVLCNGAPQCAGYNAS